MRRAAALVMMLAWSSAASAQTPSATSRPDASGVSGPDRLPPIPAAQMTEEQKKAVTEFEAARKTGISGPFVPLLRSPEVMSRARAMGDYLRFNSSLPPRLSEFAILITARRWSQNYEWDAHNRLALQAGLSPAIVNALIADKRPEKMAADEEALYDFCDELHRTQHVSDATYARAVAAFGERGVIDIVGIQGYYTLLAMVLNTARTPVPPGSTPALTHIPR